MFNRNNDDGNQSAPPPGLPPGPIPMPTIRVFKVLRSNLQGDETIVVHAHALAVADDDRTVFQTWRIDPVIGPQLQVTRVMTNVIDVEDVTPVPAEDSRILH